MPGSLEVPPLNILATDPDRDARLFWIDEEARIIDASEAAYRSLGYSREALLALKITDIDPEVSAQQWPDHWRELRRTRTQRFRTSHRHRDGSVWPVEILGHYFEIEGRGYNCALVHPLTPQRETESALRESEERLSLALAVAGQGLYDLDIPTGRAIVNDAYARMLGYAPDELDLTPDIWANWLHPDDYQHMLALYDDCVEGRRDDYQTELRLRTREGGWIWVLSAGRVVRRLVTGRAVRMIGTLLDITARKESETKLKRHLDIEQAATEISALMINPKGEELDGQLHWILERIGRLTQAERSYLLTIAPDPSAPADAHAWCGANAPPDSKTIRTFKTEDLLRAFDATPQDRVVRIRYRDLADDSPYRPYLRQGKVQSALWVPIELNGRIRGLIGLDAIDHERDWGEEDTRLLRMVAEILAHTLQHLDSDRRLKDNARFLENLDRISRILTAPGPDDELMPDLLETIRDIFQADRAFFMYPGDTGNASFHIPIEATRPEWPGATATGGDTNAEGVTVITDTYFYEMVRCLMDTPGPHTLPATEEIRNSPTVRRYNIRSQLTIALHPRSDRTWILGIHQCSHERDWSETEQRLFQAIAERVGDALSQHLLLKRLRESEHRFATAFRSNPAAMTLSTLEGRLIDANARWLELSGWAAEDLVGRTSKDVGIWVDPNFRDRMIAELLQKGSIKEAPTLIRTRNGEIRHVLWSTELIELGAQPTLLSLIQDLTHQKRAEQALRLAELSIMRSADAIFWITPDGRFMNVNDEACESLGYAREELLGKAVWDINPEFPETRWIDHWNKTREQKRRRFETTHRHQDGTIFPVEVTANHIAFNGQDYDFAFVRDISDRKLADAELRRHREHLEELVNERTSALQQAMNQLVQSEKLAALGKLVAGVAHELNTPLGNARIVASTLEARLSEIGAAIDEGTLRRSQLTAFLAHTREAVDLLERNTSRAAELIGHFKQVAVDQTSMRRRRFNLHQTLNEMLVTLRPGFKHTAHHIEIEAPPELEMDSYPGPLEQVITNLVNNALKHGFAGLKSGRIRIQAHAEGADDIAILCADDGIGIAPELLDRIFEPFFTTRLGEGGSGLGLYITYNLVTVALGGRIVVDSQPGQGTTFILTLPRVGPDGQAP
ncbi:multi-sensor signal transduction histidine kinase [Thiorhodococcus drewsii AZ1]|uniref:histidine kinase n=1 Tax=Thiorhodococcus drewsii AZ1 TaxID=765913 RepID=G2E1S4_9GAMM|nr:PAS domain S-box protein [Thiorhodococcus drewsii]EGV31132.1 multi-sensor signal transduction histidine kinase [Thiorhodococcus drewsii AZ1]